MTAHVQLIYAPDYGAPCLPTMHGNKLYQPAPYQTTKHPHHYSFHKTL